MSNYRGGILQEDCPPGSAENYPGKKTKNNKNGSEFTREEWVDKVILKIMINMKKPRGTTRLAI